MKKISVFLFALFCTCFVLNAQTYNATVAKDGSGTHTTVAAAIASAPTNSTSTYYIFVKAGVYYEKDTVPTNRPNITMVGESVLTTVIYYNDNATTTLLNGSPIGTSGSASFFVNGASFTAANLTFQNNAVDGVTSSNQAVAVNISGDKASFRNCRFLGRQDVLYCKNSGVASYFKNCYIDGTVDFIFGASTVWMDSCYIYCKSRTSGGVICAPNTAAGTSFGSPWGFVFNGCKINGASDMTGLYYLGRPWQNKPQAVYLNCNMSSVIKDSGWSRSAAGSATTADVSFGEYNSSGAGYSSTARVNFSTQLSAGQYSNYTISNVLGGWDPCTSTVSTMCNAVDLPVATANFSGTQTSGTSASLSWNMCWPLAMTYTVMRNNNGGAFSTVVSTTNGTSSNFSYSTADNSMPTGVNRYILQMTYNGTTYTSTDTITISNQPTITSSVTTLSAFSATTNTASSSQNFTISGANLTANITVTAPTNFQVSTNNSSWGSTANYTQSGGTLASTPVYVRLAAVANGSYSGNVAISTTGGTTVNVAVSGTTSSAPSYVATVLQEYPFSANNNDNSGTRAVGINAASSSLNGVALSNGTTVASVAAYSSTIGMGFAPSLTSTSTGLWTSANGGPGSSVTRLHYVQFTVSGNTGYGVRVDSVVLTSAIWNSANGRLAIVYSKSGFASDSSDVTSGGTLNGTALGANYGGFTTPITPANSTSTSGPSTTYRIPLNGSTGVSLTSGQTLTVRLYYAVGSSSTGRYGQLKNVQFKGSVTPPPPTVTSFTPTSQVSGSSVVITGTNFSGVTAVSFGGTPATSFTVNSGTQITAVVSTGTSGDVSVTTGSGTATLAGFTFQTPTTYYNVANSDVTNVSNWGTNQDGTGTNPANFTDNLQTFKIYNTGATMSGAWTVSGTNSKISVNAGSGVFNVTSDITGTVDVENDGDLEVKTATAPTFGTLYSGSTVGYSGSIDQTVSSANYYNLTLSGSGTRTFPSSVVGIANQFTTNSYNTANSGSIISFNGTSPQTIPPFTYDSLIVNNSSGCITQGGGSSVVVNKGCLISQNLTIDAGDTWVMAGSNGIAFTVASGKILTVSGTLDNQSTGTATWGSLASSGNSATLANADSARFVINSNGVYKINAPVTNGYFIGVGNYSAGSEIQVLQGAPRIPSFVGGNVTWNTTAIGTASIVQQASNTINGNFNIMNGQFNNGTGGTARALTVNGNLNVSGGEYDVNGNTSGTSAAQVLTVNGTINVTGGKLYPTISTNAGTGTINVNGNLSVTGGNFANATGSLVGNNVVLQGSAAKTSTGFTGNALILTINNAAGVTFNGNVTATTLNLTNGLANMGSNTMTVTGSVSKTNGWVNGKLSKTISTGSISSASFEVGDASNYLPVDLVFSNVIFAGNVAVSVNSPISNVPNYATSVVSPVNYVNRYWTLENVNTLLFNTYSATLNYKNTDLVGSATAASVYGYVYDGGWYSQSISAGTNANTISSVAILGNIILGNDCTLTTPTVSISTASSTVCSGNSVTFNAVGTNDGTSPVYQWKKNGIDLTTGTSITFPANSLANGDVITCVLTSNKPCVTTTTATSNQITLTIHQSPAAATISSQYGNSTTAFAMCTLGNVVSLYPSVAAGIWSSSNTGAATVVRGNNSTYSADVTAIANGNANVTYTVTTPNTTCTTATTIAVTVAQQATPNAVTGSATMCVNASSTYSTTSTGGVWSTTGRATITTGGVATGVSAGSTAIKYTITNAAGCSASSSLGVTVNSAPAVPTIAFAPGTTGVSGSGGYCKNKTFTLTGKPVNGVWSSSGVVSINPSGTNSTTTVVNTGNVTGAFSITYTTTDANGCSTSRTIPSNIVACRGISTSQSSIENNQLTVYPNPAKSFISLKVNKLTGAGSIVVTDLYGKQLKQQALSMGTNTIDVSNFAKGMYLVSVITESGKQTQKVVVE